MGFCRFPRRRVVAMKVATIIWTSSADFVRAVTAATDGGRNFLLLLDSNLGALQESFLSAFTDTAQRDGERIVLIHGVKATSLENFYAECRKVIP